MPSQEDYLDNLLKGLNGSDEENDINIDADEKMDFSGVEIEEFDEPGASIKVEDTVSMTEEDIERLLSESQEAAIEEQLESPEDPTEDLLDMLSKEDDDSLQEIHDLLQKSDNNEAINEDIIALLQDEPDEEVDLFENLMSEAEEENTPLLDEKAIRDAQRKRERDERRTEKIALREAKRAAKLEEKAAKAAEKKARKEALLEEKQKKEAQVMQETAPDDIQDFFENLETEKPENEQPLQQDELADLDDLLNMAESAVAFDDSSASDEGVDAFSELFGQEETQQEFVNTEAMVEKVLADKRPPKKNFFSRIIDMLTEEEEEEDLSKGNEDIQLSDENQTIIEELDKGKKKKGKKDKKGKKGKTSEDGDNAAEAGDSDEEAEGSKKGKKSKKEKKPKKEKIPKEVLETETEQATGSKLSFKRILPIALVCLSITVVIILIANLSGDYSAKKAGREAYYNGDYQTCYQNLYGKKLNESEQVMYSKSESIMRIRLWIREYELFVEEGAEAEALDSLIQSVNAYPSLSAYATQWNAGTEVAELYAQILTVLSDKYSLTEDQALEIAAAEDDEEYSRMVYAIIDGKEFGSWNQQNVAPEVMEDVLPEEEELGEIPFVDNNDN